MRYRPAQFSMIPMSVLQHAAVRGNASRIAVYAGVQAAGWEQPGRDWRSIRQLAFATGDIIGLGEEVCRKHLAEFIRIGLVSITNGELVLPGLGISVGSTEPTIDADWVPQNQHDDLTPSSLSKRTTKRKPRGVGMETMVEVVSLFDQFWTAYPRKIGKPAAIKAWRAVKGDTHTDAISAGLDRWVRYWEFRQEPQFVVYPATWLNQRRWEDAPPPLKRANAGHLTMEGLATLQFDENGALVE